MNEEQIDKIVKEIVSQKIGDSSNLFERDKMQKVFDAAVEKANELGVGVTMCIMDSATVIQMLYHMPNANLVSSELAPKKAWERTY